MALARFIVLAGPDAGAEFPLPMRGGGIGRGEDNIVQLSDLSVSRTHCMLELKNGQLALVDRESRNRTLVNGKPITTHVLTKGDEVTVGATRMAYLPSEPTAEFSPGAPANVTMEIASRALLTPSASADILPVDGRAQRHLASVANLGELLKGVSDRSELARTASDTIRTSLSAQRALVFLRGAGGRLYPSAASVEAGQDTDLDLPKDIIGKVLGEGKSIALDKLSIGGSERDVVSAPIWSADHTPAGLLWVDRITRRPWDRTDVVAVGCMAHLVSAAIAAFDARNALLEDNRDLVAKLGGREFVGSSGPAETVMSFVGKVAPSDATVLLTGESGSGKEMVARAVHQASRRDRQAFVAVNCAALTQSLIESELFGHEKGAFTGASERKLGRFELADKGTLFLDEVGELPLDCQTKFLRVLEEQNFERVGGGKTITVDVRVVAATNRDLPAMVRRGEFREDLYYRLSVIHTEVPPLRERRDDIPQLCEHFLARLSRQVTRRIRGFSPQAMAALTNYSWPGNVRELRNAVERAIVLGEGDQIELVDLPPNISSVTPGPAAPASPAPTITTGSPAMAPAASPAAPCSLKELERMGIVAALAATGGNKVKAASILEIDRSTLYKKIKDYGIE